MGSLPRTLELFYDVVSPYSWLGFEVLCRYQHLWNVDLQLRPSYLPGILKDSGNTGPSQVPRKLLYMVSDLRQLGRHLQVPIHTSMDLMSAVFQRGSLSAIRFLTAVHLELPEMLEQVSRQLWIHTWSLNKDITEPGSILAAAREAGMSADQAQGILEKISTPRVKDQLRETTQAACNYRGFGLPITVAHVDGQTHMLFGSDRMELLAYLLGEKWMGPVPPAPNSRM